MRVIFMGTPEFAVPTLQRLIDSEHEVVMVVMQPDRPSGRGRKVSVSPVKALALEHNLRIEQPAKLRGTDFHETMAEVNANVAVVAAYGLILPKEALDAPRYGCLNVHGSILPRWRGAAPIQRAILAGDRQTGVTIMRMDEGMDTGDIIETETVDILPDDDSQSLSDMLAVLGADVMTRTLDQLEADGAIDSRKQDDTLATAAPKITKEEGRIDWADNVDEIICRIHAMRPWPVAYSSLGGKSVKVLEAEPEFSFDESKLPEEDRAQPGAVVALLKNLGPVVRVGDGCLLLTRVQPESKRVMEGGAWINGGAVKVGAKFDPPSDA